VTADGWVWTGLLLLLVLLGVRAWVVETGHATLGRTPVKVTVLTVVCGVVVAGLAGLVAVNGGARLVYLVAHPKEAQALEDAANAADDPTTAPPAPAADPPSTPPSTPTATPTTTSAPPPPPARATTRTRPTTRVVRPPVRTTAPAAPVAPTTTTSTRATATRTTAPRTGTGAAERQASGDTPASAATDGDGGDG
jgi:hypothetical protein